MRRICSVAEWSAVLAYALLLWRLLRSGTWAHLPAFTGFVAIACAYKAWNPATVRAAMVLEPWKMSLLLCSILEALTYPGFRQSWKSQRHMVNFAAAMALPAVALMRGYFSGDSTGIWYAAIRQTMHVGMLMMALSGLLCCWMMPGTVRHPGAVRHQSILTLYVLAMVVSGFFKPDRHDAALYEEVRVWYLAAVCACCALWWRWGMLGRRRESK